MQIIGIKPEGLIIYEDDYELKQLMKELQAVFIPKPHGSYVAVFKSGGRALHVIPENPEVQVCQ